jgi:hypothetical protein
MNFLSTHARERCGKTSANFFCFFFTIFTVKIHQSYQRNNNNKKKIRQNLLLSLDFGGLSPAITALFPCFLEK